MGTSDRADVVETRTAPPPLPSGNTVNLGSSVPRHWPRCGQCNCSLTCRAAAPQGAKCQFRERATGFS